MPPVRSGDPRRSPTPSSRPRPRTTSSCRRPNLPDGEISWQVRRRHPAGTARGPAPRHDLARPRHPPRSLRWRGLSPSPTTRRCSPGRPSPARSPTRSRWTTPAPGLTHHLHPERHVVLRRLPQAPGTWFWRVRANRGNGLFTVLEQRRELRRRSARRPAAGRRHEPSPADAGRLSTGSRSPARRVPAPGRHATPTSTPSSTTGSSTGRATAGPDLPQRRVLLAGARARRRQQADALDDRDALHSSATGPRSRPLEYPLEPVRPDGRQPDVLPVDARPPRAATSSTSGATRTSRRHLRHVHHDGHDVPSPRRQPANSCGPLGQGETTYWRVKALDDPTGVEGIYSEIHHFVYSAGQITPDLSGQRGHGRRPYARPGSPSPTRRPTRSSQGQERPGRRVSSTPARPPGRPSGSLRRRATPTPGPSSPRPLRHRSRRCTRAPPSTSRATSRRRAGPGPDHRGRGDPATVGLPGPDLGADDGRRLLPGADRRAGLRLLRREASSHINDATYPYPAATDTGTHYLSAGHLLLVRRAYNSSNQLIGTSAGRLRPVHDQGPAGRDRPGGGARRLSRPWHGRRAARNGCRHAQPDAALHRPLGRLRSWLGPRARAAGYLSTSATTGSSPTASRPYAVTTNTIWRPPTDLPDNTAQDSYYWFVRPCKSLHPPCCNPDPISTQRCGHQRLPQGVTGGRAAGAGRPGLGRPRNPTFSWTDYSTPTSATPTRAARTRRTRPRGPTGSRSPRRRRSTPWSTTARSTSRSTPPTTGPCRRDALLAGPGGRPRGQPPQLEPGPELHQRRAGGRPCCRRDVPSPVGGATVAGSTPFRWAPSTAPGRTQIEVYNGDDATHSPGEPGVQRHHPPAGLRVAELPAAVGQAYRWRVRWFDADGQPRPFSADGRFFVSASSVTPDRSRQPALPEEQRPLLHLGCRTVRGELPPRLPRRQRAQLVTADDRCHRRGPVDRQRRRRTTGASRRSTPTAARSPSAAGERSRSTPRRRSSPAYSPNAVGIPTSKVKVTFNERMIGVSGSTFPLHRSRAARPSCRRRSSSRAPTERHPGAEDAPEAGQALHRRR